jgi:hypothetical protein
MNNISLTASQNDRGNRIAFCMLIFAFVMSLSSCKNDHFRQHPAAQASLCLSFDDYGVNEWFTLRELFLKYEARVIFFVTKYPYSAKYWFTDKELLNYFYVLRSSLPIKGDIAKMDNIFYPFDGGRLIMAISIDRGKGLNKKLLAKAMGRARERKEALLLHGHEPGRSFDVTFLEEILQLAQANQLAFLRVSDLVIG